MTEATQHARKHLKKAGLVGRRVLLSSGLFPCPLSLAALGSNFSLCLLLLQSSELHFIPLNKYILLVKILYNYIDIQSSQIHRDRKQNSDGQGLEGEKKGERLINGQVLFGKMKTFWIWMLVTVTQPCECTWCHWTGHLESTSNSISYHNFEKSSLC